MGQNRNETGKTHPNAEGVQEPSIQLLKRSHSEEGGQWRTHRPPQPHRSPSTLSATVKRASWTAPRRCSPTELTAEEMMFCFPGSRDSNISVRPLGGEQQDGGPDREDCCYDKNLEKVLFHQILDFL
jgi:hypothetical protein